MARSDIKTWLPLDEFAQIIGLNPLNFNQLTSTRLPQNTICGDVFFSESWMHSDRVGRNDIAYAIQQAEQDISREVGFNLLPDWTLDERLAYPRPAPSELYGTGVNPRLMLKSVEALRGHIISGGQRIKTLLEANAAVVRTDPNGDGYSELCAVTVAITTTDTNEVHVYYPNQGGADGWEVRPIKVSISGGFATITFNSWQIPIATAMDALDAKVLDGDAVASYETTVDVYRVYNYVSPQVQFLWEGGTNCCGTCVACQLGTQDGCFHLRDARMGVLVPAPATYDAAEDDWTGADWTACREPDQLRLWYYSGWRNQNLLRPYVDLDPFWKYAIAYYAASKFEREVCGCSNVNQFISKWRLDAAFRNDTEGFTMTAEMASNRLGTTMGGIYAWRAIQKNGVRLNK